MSLPGGGGAYSYRQLMQLWTAAGGAKALAPIMAAIAMAESGGNPSARNPSGATGLWQILGAVHPADQSRLTDPNVNASEAVAKYHTQGLGAWTTYTSGAYKKFLQAGASAKPAVTGGQAFLDEAEKFTGTPYVWGGESPKGFDCSGLVQYVAQKLGLKNVPRTSEAQWGYVQRIDRAQLKPGDLIFYAGSDGTDASPGHVAIYAGGNQIIQAEETGTNVGKFPIDSAGTPVGYGRIPGVNQASINDGGVSAHVGPGGGGAGDSVWNSIASGILSGVNDVAGTAGSIASGGPLGAIAASVVKVEQGVAWFFVPSHWVRIICGVLGVPLVGIGIVTMTKGAQPVPISAGPVSTEVSAGSISPAIGIAEVTLGAILLFVAFHNLDADGVHDWPSLLGYFQNALHTQGATSGGGG